MPRVRLRRVAAQAGLAALLTPLLLAGPATGVTEQVVTTREVIGTTVQGRPIVVVRRARPGATRDVLVLGNLHGDEQAGLRVVRRLRQRDRLPADLVLWLVRSANPDGTAADRRTNANGVDLNRNFPYRWRTGPHGPTWSGPTRLSEPESQALRALYRRIDPVLTVTFHQPLVGVGANEKDMGTVREISRGMRLPVDDFDCSGVCYGTFADWVNHRSGGLGVTVELGHRVPAWRVTRATRTIVSVGSLRR